ncbi:site-specific integrase [Lacticaseibacillus jixiensis]|uniref:site-specific integrase n=1 Tax=Lacticaseibacillus jixiensis TaxID=3231926 RepID=UPI0036F42B0E
MARKIQGVRQRYGKWEYRFRYTDKDGKRRELTKGGFISQKAAANAMAEVKRKFTRGADGSKLNVTLVDFWHEWFDLYKQPYLTEHTRAGYDYIIDNLESYFGTNKKLADMTKDDFQRFLNAYAEGRVLKDGTQKPRSFDSVLHLIIRVRMMVVHAMEEQIIFYDWTHDVTNPGYRQTRAETMKKFLDTADMQLVIQACLRDSNRDATFKPSNYKYMILTGLMTGARFSEVAGLTWDRINFKDRLLTIDRCWSGTKKTFTKTKTDQSVRTIDISLELVKILHKWQKEQAAFYKECGYTDPLNLVFRDYHLLVPTNSMVNKSLHRLQSRVAIDPDDQISFHGLRHTHASFLLASGVAVPYISRRLGHKNITTTLNVYSHLLKNYEQAQAEKAVDALNGLTKVKKRGRERHPDGTYK